MPDQPPPIQSAVVPRLAAWCGAALMFAAAGCTIMLPEGRQAQSTQANAAMPAPPGVIGASSPSVQRGDHGQPLPAVQTYRGVLPCADCAGQRLTLTLMPDWTWRLRRVYFGTRDGKDATFVTTGRWERNVDNARRIRLIGDRNETALYEFQSGNMLRLLDQDGQQAQTALNYSLTQQFEVDLIADTFTLRGKVRPVNGRKTMTICSTGKEYPIAQTAQYQALDEAYARLRVAPNTPVLMWINGRIESGGQAPQEQVVVESMSRGTLDSPCD